MRKIIRKILPPKRWQLPVLVLLGIFAGLGGYVLYISNAVAYLSDDPKACVNCHIMTPQYSTWKHSSHRENATCNDCHVPHDNVANKYYFKAKDGLRHATMFTLRMEPQVIRIHEAGQEVVQNNCKRCHERLNEPVGTLKINVPEKKHGEGKLCWDCHREVPHGRVNSQSSTPFARAPLPESPVPEWLKDAMDDEGK
ncbi:cytochrome c nitrite reductase small subunit (plasmid) [Fulvitalea axinellae]|uniref:Cytochrome c nitrite reductase small subunit n=1 Tax=Fulvitalea axinellae TaxID=1182444 RepID=A0AAU9DFW3_9BACT|nr:cytochrome c nitrite reductase small subunit [Fulvitalea axinellae]